LIDKDYLARRTARLGGGQRPQQQLLGKPSTTNVNDNELIETTVLADTDVTQPMPRTDGDDPNSGDDSDGDDVGSSPRLPIISRDSDNSSESNGQKSTSSRRKEKEGSTQSSTSAWKQKIQYQRQKRIDAKKSTRTKSPRRNPKRQARTPTTPMNEAGMVDPLPEPPPKQMATIVPLDHPDEASLKWDNAKAAAEEPTARRHADHNILKGERGDYSKSIQPPSFQPRTFAPSTIRTARHNSSFRDDRDDHG
jgi:hypothetical protein